MNIAKGEILILDNNKEYLILDIINCHKTEYVYLTTISKPIEILIGRKVEENGESYIDKVNDQEEIKYVLSVLLEKEKVLEQKN